MEKIQVSLGDVSLNKLPFVIAYEEGIYKKNGLEVDPFITSGAADIVLRSGIRVPEEFVRPASGDIPIAIGGGSPFIVGRVTNAQSVDRVILASTDHMVRWRIVARPDITDPKQIKGKRLGYSSYGSMTHFTAINFARTMGWDPNQDLSLMSGALNVKTLKEGRVDAFVADEIHETMALASRFKELINLKPFNIPIAGSGVNVSRTWLKAHREAARLFVKSTVEAVALLKQDKKAAFRGMSKWYRVTDPENQEHFYRDASILPRKPYPAVEGIKKVMETFDCHEMRRYKPEDFYDDGFVRELDQSGYIDSLYA
ncbi:MAG: ABC transporter substrate-binding protein [Thermodesulfobacteriota bacterium]